MSNSKFDGIFKHVDNLTTFNTLRVSGNSNNTISIINGAQQVGTPEIFWDNVVFIDNESYIWTHGKIYNDVTDKVSKTELSNQSYVTQSSLSSNSYAGYTYVYNSYSYLIDKINDVHDQTYFYVAQGIEEIDEKTYDFNSQVSQLDLIYAEVLSDRIQNDLIYSEVLSEIVENELTYTYVLSELEARITQLEQNNNS